MYNVIRFMGNEREFLILASGFKTLEDAKHGRKFSGDVVSHGKDNKVSTDPSWLWDWEKEDAKTYAHRKLVQSEKGFIGRHY